MLQGKHPNSRNGFKKGNIPWNKGLSRAYSPEYLEKLKVSHTGFVFTKEHRRKIGLKSLGNQYAKGVVRPKDENHHSWKGNSVGYHALHSWVYRHLGKAIKCVNGHTAKIYYWANVSGEYKRELSDWHELCPSCNKLDGVKINPRFKQGGLSL